MNLAFEGFTEAEIATLRGDFQLLKSLATASVTRGCDTRPWFGSSSPATVSANLRKVYNVIIDSLRRFTIVNRRGGVLKVNYKSLLEPELMPKGSPGEPLTGPGGGAIAYVFPVNRLNEKRGAEFVDDIAEFATRAHVG